MLCSVLTTPDTLHISSGDWKQREQRKQESCTVFMYCYSKSQKEQIPKHAVEVTLVLNIPHKM